MTSRLDLALSISTLFMVMALVACARVKAICSMGHVQKLISWQGGMIGEDMACSWHGHMHGHAMHGCIVTSRHSHGMVT